MKNNVQVLVDRMIDSLPKDFTPKEIHSSYAHKNKLGKEYEGLRVKYSINQPEHSIHIQ